MIFCDFLYCDFLTYDEGEALQGSNRHLGFTKWISRGNNCKIMKSILWVKVIQMLRIAKIWFFIGILHNLEKQECHQREIFGSNRTNSNTFGNRGLQNSRQSYTSSDVMTICKSVSEILYTDCDVMAIVAVVVVVAVAYLEFQCCRIE